MSPRVGFGIASLWNLFLLPYPLPPAPAPPTAVPGRRGIPQPHCPARVRERQLPES